MNATTFTRPLGPLALLAVLGLAPAAAQTTTARGTAAIVNALGISQQLASSTLPTYGGVNAASVDAAGLPGLLSASALNSITTGMLDVSTTTAQTSSELGSVSVLNGLIRADQVLAVASSYVNGTTAASDAVGSTLTGLVVAGQAFSSTPAPNTRVSLPGVGYAILNEQTITNTASGSGITVNMIHVVMQGLFGATTGEIILGSAASAVSR